MDRREFLTAQRPSVSPSLPAVPPQLRDIQSGLAPYSGTWGTVEVAHLLKRTMFGASKADIDYFKTRTSGQAVDELLTVPATPPPHPVKNYDNANIDPADADYSIPQGQTWVTINTNDGTANSKRITSLKSGGWD